MSRMRSAWARISGRLRAAPAAPQLPQGLIIDRRRMNEDWKRGDLAVCIRDTFAPFHPESPREGDLLRVRDIHDLCTLGMRFYSLSFDGKPADAAWECTCFRKVRPEEEPAEAEFIADVKRRAKPKVDA